MQRIFKLMMMALLCQLTAKAQSKTDLIGKWAYKEVANSNKLDPAKVKMMDQVFSTMALELRSDGSYRNVFFDKEEGEWRYDETLKQLTLKANKGTESVVAISTTKDGLLLYQFDADKAILLKRVSDAAEGENGMAADKLPLVSITPDALCHKWYFLKRNKQGTSTEIVQWTDQQLEGSFFQFYTNGTYLMKWQKLEERGKWQLMANNTELWLEAEGEKKFWTIRKADGEQLHLGRGKLSETWIFSVKP